MTKEDFSRNFPFLKRAGGDALKGIGEFNGGEGKDRSKSP